MAKFIILFQNRMKVGTTEVARRRTLPDDVFGSTRLPVQPW